MQIHQDTKGPKNPFNIIVVILKTWFLIGVFMKLFLEKEQPLKPQSVSRHIKYIKKNFNGERLYIMSTVMQDYLQTVVYPGWLILFPHSGGVNARVNYLLQIWLNCLWNWTSISALWLIVSR